MVQNSDEKNEKEGDEILRRLLKTPPQPKETGKKDSEKERNKKKDEKDGS